jgi:hypothetical protein
VRYLEQARLGLSASRNLALASATQPVLAVTDDDCVPDGGWVAALADAIGREPVAGAVTGPILTLGPKPPGGFAISLRESRDAVEYSGDGIVPWGVGSGANFAARVEELRELGGWDQRLGTGSPGRAAEDADLVHRLLGAGALIRYEPAAVVRPEWQTRSRRLETHWSYGYGVGAMCGLCLARRERFVPRMLTAYCRHHLRLLLGGLRRGDRMRIAGHGRALASVAPGLAYGLRAGRRRSASVR